MISTNSVQLHSDHIGFFQLMHPNWALNGTLPKTSAVILPFGQEHAVQTSAMLFKCVSSILNEKTPIQQLDVFKSWEHLETYHHGQKHQLTESI